MNHSSLILVTGATGAVGPHVVASLFDAGYQIRTLSLDSPPPRMWPDGIETRVGDVTDPIAVQSAMQGVDSVIHLAALLHIVNPTPVLRKKYEKINIGGTATAVEAAVRAGVRRLVFFSTIAVYGDSRGQVLTEETAPHPETIYATTKMAAEKIVLTAKRPDGQPLGVVLRLGAVYGSRVKGNYRRLLESLARGWFIPIGAGWNRRTLIYDKDVAGAAVLALHHPAAAGKVFNVSDGQFHKLNEIITTICEVLGRTPPRISIPVGPARWGAGILEDAAQLIGRKSPIVRATIDKYTEDIAVDSQRIQTELGFKPQFDLKSGWRETVQEMRKMGEF
jgi:nucleoside-diphosphate-sugar epimerase